MIHINEGNMDFKRSLMLSISDAAAPASIEKTKGNH